MTPCDLNPVVNNVYKWGDRPDTTVEIHEDGSATITQGGNKIKLDCFSFFKDVAKVFHLAIESMPESDDKRLLWYKSLVTSRSLPYTKW